MASISTTPSPSLKTRVSRPILDYAPPRSILRRTSSTNSMLTPAEKSPSAESNLKPAPKPPRAKPVIPECWGVVIGRKNDDEFIRLPLYRKSYSIGRDISNDIIVPSPVYSNIHCSIEKSDNGMITVSDTSHNGISLNGCIMSPRCQGLKDGDTLSLLDYSFHFATPKTTKLSPIVPNNAADEASTSTPTIQPPMTDNVVPPHTPTSRLLQSPMAPQSALLLSRLVASPKRVPTPTFMRTSTPIKPPVMTRQRSIIGDESDEGEDERGALMPPSPSARRSMSRLTPTVPSTPKHKSSDDDMDTTVDTPSSKKVRFGPTLSPEVFSKDEPPATPVKRGETTRPGTPRRALTSTATLLERLKTSSPAKSSIASPRSLQRTADFAGLLQKPKPLRLVEADQSQSSTAVEDISRVNLTTLGNPFAPSSPASQ